MANTKKQKATKKKPETTLKKTIQKKRTKKSNEIPAIIENKATTTTTTTTAETSLSSLVHEPSWSKHLQNLFNGENFKRIEQYLNTEWSAKKVTYPPKNLIFEAFNKTPFDKVKVVLIGQDPYHDDGQVNHKK